jgi:hypothetical protein
MKKCSKSQVFNMNPEVVAKLMRYRPISTKKQRIESVRYMVEKDCREELAYALFYMKYLHPSWPKDQTDRVIALCEEFRNKQSYYDGKKHISLSLAYWTDFRGRIKDEIENMC